MHRTHVRSRFALVCALAVVLTLGACELADSPEADTSTSPAADTSASPAADTSASPAADEGVGEDGTSDDGDVIEVEMTEFAYEPSTIELTAGEPTVVRFTNVGEIEHEAMLGTAHMQQEFASDDGHDHGGHHGDVEAVTVAPGETAELEVLIEEPGTWYLGCHLEGHYDAGMEAEVHVTR